MRHERNDPTPDQEEALAAQLGVSVRTIDGWVARRTIPFIAASPRLHLFDLAAVRKTLEDRFGVKPRKSERL